MSARTLLCALPILTWVWSPVSWAQEAQLAIIIDDIGYSAALGERSLNLPGDFTFAVLPKAPHGPRLARLGAAGGKEIMVHAPMSNTRGLPLDEGALHEEMNRQQFVDTLERNLQAIPEARGLNNHMGSQLTQESIPMGWLMEQLAQRELYFIDSRTTAQSQAWETARRYQVPSLKRDVFLDHQRDSEQIALQVSRAITLAQQRGHAVAIGHPYPETLEVLEQIKPLLEAAQVQLVPVSTLLDSHPDSRWQAPGKRCPAPPQTLWHQPNAGPEPVNFERWLELPHRVHPVSSARGAP